MIRIITSQYDHGGYLCMGINNFLSLQESWHLPPPPFASRGRLSRVWPARLLLPAFLLFLSLSFSPFSHFTHLQPDELLTEMEYQAQLSPRRNVAPRRQAFTETYSQAALCLCLPSSICMESSTIEGVPVAESLPEEANGIGDSKQKRQRRKHAHRWQHFTRAPFQAVDSRQNLDANQSNQRIIPLARVSRELRVRALQASRSI